MAENPIRKEDIIDGAGITAVLKELISLLQGEFKQALISIQKEAGGLKTSLSGLNATTVDGQQAIRTITEQTNTLNAEYIKTSVAVKELEKAERSRLKIEQEEIKYGKIQAGSYKDLTAKLKQLREETLRQSAPAQDNINKIKAYETQLKKLDAQMGRHQRNVGNYASAFKNLGVQLLGVAGVTGGVATAIKAIGGVINVTQSLSDAWKVTLSGLQFGLREVGRELATMDFRGFISNIEEAVKRGREYAKALDDIEDRSRAVSVRESEIAVEVAKLNKELRNTTLTETRRIEIGKEILAKEKEIANARIENSKRVMDEEFQNAAQASDLSREQIANFIRTYDQTENQRKAAEELLDAEKQLTAAMRLRNDLMADVGQTEAIKSLDAQIKQYKETIAGASDEQRTFAALLTGYNKLGDNAGQEIDKLVKSIVEYNGQLASFDERTRRADTSVNTLTASLNKKSEAFTVSIEKIEDETAALDNLVDSILAVANAKNAATDEEKRNAEEKAASDKKAITDSVVAYAEGEDVKRNQASETVESEKEGRRESVEQTLSMVSDGISALSDLYSSQKQRELSAAGDNAKKREEIERKYFRKQQALSIAQAIVNGALAVTTAMAQTGILSPFVIPGIIAVTLAQIALISSQKFAKGGFTGRGHQRDETGERVAGIVHEDEFVINKKQTKKYRPLLDAIHRDDRIAIASALNNSNIVWDRTAQIMNEQDPYTEKMYQLMKDTPTSYIDSTGATVLVYPGGRKKIIKRHSGLHYNPSMIR